MTSLPTPTAAPVFIGCSLEIHGSSSARTQKIVVRFFFGGGGRGHCRPAAPAPPSFLNPIVDRQSQLKSQVNVMTTGDSPTGAGRGVCARASSLSSRARRSYCRTPTALDNEPYDPRLPSRAVVEYARRTLSYRYRIPVQDTDDVIAQAFLDFLSAKKDASKSHDGLFLAIVYRRSCDFWRSYHSWLPLSAARAPSYAPDDSDLEATMICKQVSRAATKSGRRRLARLTRYILAGESFSDACRAVGIPNGSHSRYRARLRACLRNSALSFRPPPTTDQGPGSPSATRARSRSQGSHRARSIE